MDKIPIIHIYGSLGKPDFLYTENTRPYSDRVDEVQVRICMNQMNLMYESYSEVDPRIYDLINKASHIVFLGFGYHEANLKRLRMSEFIDTHIIYGTFHGVSQGEKERYKNHVEKHVFNQKVTQLRDSEYDALNFWRERNIF